MKKSVTDAFSCRIYEPQFIADFAALRLVKTPYLNTGIDTAKAPSTQSIHKNMFEKLGSQL